MKNLFNEKYYNEQKFRFGEISEKISPEEIENMYSEVIAEFPDKGLTVFQNDGRNFYELYNLDRDEKNSLNTNSILVGGLFDDSFFRVTNTGIAFKNSKGQVEFLDAKAVNKCIDECMQSMERINLNTMDLSSEIIDCTAYDKQSQ